MDIKLFCPYCSDSRHQSPWVQVHFRFAAGWLGVVIKLPWMQADVAPQISFEAYIGQGVSEIKLLASLGGSRSYVMAPGCDASSLRHKANG